MPKTKSYEGFTDAERAAMKDRAAELKSSGRAGSAAKKAEAERQAALDAIAEMPDGDRVIAEALHSIVAEQAPDLAPRTWYGMPAYAKEGKVIVFFKPGSKFKMRYAEIGFSDNARLDSGDMWATAFGVTKLNDGVENKLRALIKKAASQPVKSE